MRLLRRFKPSPGLVIGSIALLIALGGTGYAAQRLVLPRNSVGTAQLKNDAVVSSKVKNGSLLSADFKAGQLPAGPRGRGVTLRPRRRPGPFPATGGGAISTPGPLRRGT